MPDDPKPYVGLSVERLALAWATEHFHDEPGQIGRQLWYSVNFYAGSTNPAHVAALKDDFADAVLAWEITRICWRGVVGFEER